MARQDQNISGIKHSLVFPNKRVFRWVFNLHLFRKSFVSSGLGAVNGVDSLQMWKVAANILNERRRTENKGWSLLLGVGRDAKNPSSLNLAFCRVLQNNVKGGILWIWEETFAFHWRYGIVWPAVWLLAPQNAPRCCVVATTRIHSQADYIVITILVVWRFFLRAALGGVVGCVKEEPFFTDIFKNFTNVRLAHSNL